MVTRIDDLRPGAEVVLSFGSEQERVIFVQMVGEGNDRRAVFASAAKNPDGKLFPFTWEAYRFQGHWVYGTSAQRLSLVKPLSPT